MTPAEKAKSLLEELRQTGISVWEAKACAKIAVREIINSKGVAYPNQHITNGEVFLDFWRQVKQELIKPSQAAQPRPGQLEKS